MSECLFNHVYKDSNYFVAKHGGDHLAHQIFFPIRLNYTEKDIGNAQITCLIIRLSWKQSVMKRK